MANFSQAFHRDNIYSLIQMAFTSKSVKEQIHSYIHTHRFSRFSKHSRVTLSPLISILSILVGLSISTLIHSTKFVFLRCTLCRIPSVSITIYILLHPSQNEVYVQHT